MKKTVASVVLILLVVIGAGLYFLVSNLDTFVKQAIETYGSQATGTPVRVEQVKIGLSNGIGAIHGLTVANPKGYATAQAFSLGEISLQVDLKAISEKLVAVNRVRVLVPQVFFELNQAGRSNLVELKKRLETVAAVSSSPSDAKATKSSESSKPVGPKLLIRKLEFADGSIHARVTPLDKDYDVPLPKIELSNLGGKNGMTPEQLSAQILKILTDRALAEVKRRGLDKYRQQLEGEVNKRIDAGKQKLEKKLGEKIDDQVGDQLKQLLNK